jgi:hypothetical protein
MLKASARLQWARCAAGVPGTRGFRVLGWSGSRPVHGVVEARSRTNGSPSWMPESGVRFHIFQPPGHPNLPIIVLTTKQKIHHGGTETRRRARAGLPQINADERRETRGLPELMVQPPVLLSHSFARSAFFCVNLGLNPFWVSPCLRASVVGVVFPITAITRDHVRSQRFTVVVACT